MSRGSKSDFGPFPVDIEQILSNDWMNNKKKSCEHKDLTQIYCQCDEKVVIFSFSNPVTMVKNYENEEAIWFLAKYFNQKSIFFFEIGDVCSFKCLRSICSAPLMFTFQCCQFIFWKLLRNIWCIFVIINFISVLRSGYTFFDSSKKASALTPGPSWVWPWALKVDSEQTLFLFFEPLASAQRCLYRGQEIIPWCLHLVHGGHILQLPLQLPK